MATSVGRLWPALDETCDADRPHLITDVAVVPATTPDVTPLPGIHERLAQRNLLPAEHLGDAGYPTGRFRVPSWAQGVRLIGPLQADNSWQARTPGGLTGAQSDIDWARQLATCPQGQTSPSWSLHDDPEGQPVVDIKFPPAICAACPSHRVHPGCPGPDAAPQYLLRYHPGGAPAPKRPSSSNNSMPCARGSSAGSRKPSGRWRPPGTLSWLGENPCPGLPDCDRQAISNGPPYG